MADAAFVFSPTRTSIGAISLDASISENHTFANEVTEHPVEAGADISDHIRSRPNRLTVEGMVSNVGLDGAPRDNSREAFEALLSLKESGTLITVATGLRTYENMVIENLTVPRGRASGDLLRFSATLKQVRIVQSTETVISLATRTPRAKGKVTLGQRAVKELQNLARIKFIVGL